jgi:hypothetical protein
MHLRYLCVILVSVSEWQWLHLLSVAYRTAQSLVTRSKLPEDFLALNEAESGKSQ